jgi:DNA-binding CsgD family transcriptional regulator
MGLWYKSTMPRKVRRRPHRLTEREKEVAKLYADGLATAEVATRLNITSNTALSHRANIMRKLGLERVTQIVRWAIEEGIA